MRKRAALFLSLLLGIPAAVILFLVLTHSPESLSPGDRIHSITATDLQGRQLPIRANPGDGGEHLWLVVSASCPVCKQEITEIESRKEISSRLTVVSLSPLEDTRDFMRSFPKVRQRTVVDAGREMERAYGKFYFPTGLLMDESGTLVKKWRGALPSQSRSVLDERTRDVAE